MQADEQTTHRELVLVVSGRVYLEGETKHTLVVRNIKHTHTQRKMQVEQYYRFLQRWRSLGGMRMFTGLPEKCQNPSCHPDINPEYLSSGLKEGKSLIKRCDFQNKSALPCRTLPYLKRRVQRSDVITQCGSLEWTGVGWGGGVLCQDEGVQSWRK